MRRAMGGRGSGRDHGLEGEGQWKGHWWEGQ